MSSFSCLFGANSVTRPVYHFTGPMDLLSALNVGVLLEKVGHCLSGLFVIHVMEWHSLIS